MRSAGTGVPPWTRPPTEAALLRSRSSGAEWTKKIARGQHDRAASLRFHRTVPAVEGGAPAPTGPLCVHEIKHDGYRLMVRPG